MATKLGRKVMPSGHTRDDFKCFGPAVTEDDKFDGTMIADLGCFAQEDVDSNKYYHGAVVQSTINSQWYAYFEWGRVGASPDFLFVECDDKSEAEREYVKQVKSKNIKRGEWTTISGLRVLRPKVDKHGKSKDLYLVRPAARRTTGLPDGQKVITDDSDQSKKAPSTKTAKKKSTVKKVTLPWDQKTLELGRDLTNTVLDYTRKSFAGDYVPTQKAIDDGRDILTEALKRVKKIGNSTEDQVADRELKELTTILYSRVAKVKSVGAAASTWILSGDNIHSWGLDLDTFESALLALDAGATADDTQVTMNDPFAGFDLHMKWMDPKTIEGAFIRKWMPEASGGRHSWVGNMNIKNMWAVRQPGQHHRFVKKVGDIAKDKTSGRREKARYQPSTRPDLSDSDKKLYRDANVALLFHGTRTVNVTGILRTGLKLPRQLVGVAITGAMFGPGIYWADDWRKSDGYTSRDGTYWAGGAGGIKGRGAMMFIANVALGNPHVAGSYGGFTKPPHGHHCVAGLAGKSGVQNNEWIVYNGDQNNLGYLVEYDTKSGRGY